jgi:hypothetical protein
MTPTLKRNCRLNCLHYSYMQVTGQFYAPAYLSQPPNPRGNGDEETNSAPSRNRTPSTSVTARHSRLGYSDQHRNTLTLLGGSGEQLGHYEWQNVIKSNTIS